MKNNNIEPKQSMSPLNRDGQEREVAMEEDSEEKANENDMINEIIQKETSWNTGLEDPSHNS